MKKSLTNGVFVKPGDLVEFETDDLNKVIMVVGIEINPLTGEAVIHGNCDKGNRWTVPAKNLAAVIERGIEEGDSVAGDKVLSGLSKLYAENVKK